MKINFLVIASVFFYSPIWAFEIGTHALISKVAYDRSVLSPSHPTSIIPVLGFDRLDAKAPFTAPYPAMFQAMPLT